MLNIKNAFDELAKLYPDCTYALFWDLYDISRSNNADRVYYFLETAQEKEQQQFCYRVLADILHTGSVLI